MITSTDQNENEIWLDEIALGNNINYFCDEHLV